MHRNSPTQHVHASNQTHAHALSSFRDHYIDLQYAAQAVCVIKLTLETKRRAAGNSKR